MNSRALHAACLVTLAAAASAGAQGFEVTGRGTLDTNVFVRHVPAADAGVETLMKTFLRDPRIDQAVRRLVPRLGRDQTLVLDPTGDMRPASSLAYRKLQRLGPDALPELIVGCEHPDPRVRVACARLVAGVAGEAERLAEMEAVFIRGLFDRGAAARVQSIHVLHRIHDSLEPDSARARRIVRLLSIMRADREESVRHTADRVLSALEEPARSPDGLAGAQTDSPSPESPAPE